MSITRYFATILLIFVSKQLSSHTLTLNTKSLQERTYFKNTSYIETEDGHTGIGIQENEYNHDTWVELLLSFNKEAQKLKHYHILESNILLDPLVKQLGRSSGKFYQFKPGLTLRPKKDSWFYKSEHLGDFTIEFWIKPKALSDGEIIFKRYGPIIARGKVISHSGILCLIQSRRIQWRFRDIFHHPQVLLENRGKRQEVSASTHSGSHIQISSTQTVQKDTWSHHAITYNSHTGQLIYYINGKEESAQFITESGHPDDTILIPRFYAQSRAPLIIGETYIGYLDEFMISKKVKAPISYFSKIPTGTPQQYTTLHTEKYKAREGLITSSIYDLKQSGSHLKAYTMDLLLEGDGLFILQARMRDQFFTAYTGETTLPWVTINKESSINLPSKELQGRYFQWRAILKSNHNNSRTPILKRISFDFFIDHDPKVPVGLTVQTEGKQIILQWAGNIENDLQGYRIYYAQEKSRVTFAHKPIEIAIGDIQDIRKPYYVFSELEKSHLYYFVVTAVDKENHESSPSEYAFAFVP